MTLAREFANPSAEYGPIDGWWWEAGRLDRERMRWQLEELKDKGVAGTWFYARYLYDEPLASDPRYFTDEWWEFTRFAAEEQRRLGLRNVFSVWTALEFEQDAIRAQREASPELWGRSLALHSVTSEAAGPLALEIPAGDEVLDVAAYRVDGDGLDYASRVPVTGREWSAPGPGWLLTALVARPWDLDYLGTEVGRRWPDVVLGEYERRLPGFMGDGIEAFGPDEMTLLNATAIYSPGVVERMGFDATPHLIALFHDIGPRTDEIRCRYYDAMCALLEENFYLAPTRWLHARGMQHASISQLGSDPLSQTFHYGDFMRYLRSFDIPGNEDPGAAPPGQRRLLQSKLSSSVTNLYGSGRAVVLGHYCSGWGHTLEENLAWTNEAYAKGMNLYSRHLASYSLMGGWYEYVPPSDHFHHPCWRYWKHFADYVRRLSFVLSQGRHRADVALLYPISTIHAHWRAGAELSASVVALGETMETDEPASLDVAFEASEAAMVDALKVFGPAAHEASDGLGALADAIYGAGLDFTIVDNEALAGATVADGVLEIAGVQVRSVVLPPMTTIPTGVAEVMKRFVDAGGTVGALGRLPRASVERGRDDPRLRELMEGIFVSGEAAEVPRELAAAIVPDVVVSEGGVFHTHRHSDGIDIYFLFNTEERERDVTVRLRVDADVERWDPFTGDTAPVHRIRRGDGCTEVDLRMEVFEGVVLVCSPGESRPAVAEGDPTETVELPVEGPWSFRLEPTMDNRWGDFRHPPSPSLIGAEARRFSHREEGERAGTELGWHLPGFGDGGWDEALYSHGPYWRHLGPVRDDTMLARALRGDATLEWQRFEFSKRYGSARQAEGWPGAEHLLGVSNNFLVFDRLPDEAPDGPHRHYLFTCVEPPAAGEYRFVFGYWRPHDMISMPASDREPFDYQVPIGTRLWIDGEAVAAVTEPVGPELAATVHLKAGRNAVLLEVVQPDRSRVTNYAAFLRGEPEEPDPYAPAVRWSQALEDFVYDVDAARVGWYRFLAPPGMREMRLRTRARAMEAWVDGRPVDVRDGTISLPAPVAAPSRVALRVEHVPGVYGGAAFDEPIAFDCAEGRIELGDWSSQGLATYSGIGVYATEIALTASQAAGRVVLDLGRVKTVADVSVNGKPAGVRIARPFRFDVTELVREGSNRIEVKVANTLANHMSSYPTRWILDGQTVSGLLGPVSVRVAT